MRRVFAEIDLGIARFRQEEHTAHKQRYCGFTGDASTSFGSPHGACAVRGAAADRGCGAGGVRGAPVVVRSREAARWTPAGGAQRAPARAQDSHRARRGGRAGPQGAQPLGFPGAVPLVGSAALRSALREPGCGDPVAVPARGVDRADASGGRCAGGRGGRARAVER